jgi:hypothetical protein
LLILFQAIISILFGNSSVPNPSSIPFPGDPQLDKWQPVNLRAPSKAIARTYGFTDITPGVLATISTLVCDSEAIHDTYYMLIYSVIGPFCGVG